MSMVQQNADGMVFIRTPGGTYMDTIANFQLDFNDTVPPLPSGANDRVYDQGVRHAITDGHTIIAGGHQPWTQGDNWINNVQTGLANQATRQAAEVVQLKAQMETRMTETLNAKQIAQASPNDGSSSPQPQVRQESGSASESREGVQPSRQRDWNLAKEKTEELKRRL